MSEFISDLAAIRQRARQSIEDGAVTGGYKADREKVVEVLNEALATELVCILRYKRHYYITPTRSKQNSSSMPAKNRSMPIGSPSASRSSTASQITAR
jgi:hypothetical protein